MLNKRVLFVLLFCINLLGSEKLYLKYFDENTDSYYVKINGITNPIKLVQMTGIPYVIELESLSNNIKLLHGSAGAQGTSVLIDYNYTYILHMNKKTVVGFLQYDDDNGHYTKEDKTPKWKLKKNSLVAKYFSEEKNQYVNIEFYFSDINNLEDSSKEFQKIYKQLKTAIKNKDLSAFYYSVSVDFKTVNGENSDYNNRKLAFSVQDFMKNFVYKNESNSYNISWELLGEYFQNNIYIKREDNSICLPKGIYNNQKKFDSFLCFKKYKHTWLIKDLILSEIQR